MVNIDRTPGDEAFGAESECALRTDNIALAFTTKNDAAYCIELGKGHPQFPRQAGGPIARYIFNEERFTLQRMNPERLTDLGLSHTGSIVISGNACPVHFFGKAFVNAAEIIYPAIHKLEEVSKPAREESSGSDSSDIDSLLKHAKAKEQASKRRKSQ